MSEQTLEQRVSTLEKEIAELKVQAAQASERLKTSIAGYPGIKDYDGSIHLKPRSSL